MNTTHDLLPLFPHRSHMPYLYGYEGRQDALLCVGVAPVTANVAPAGDIYRPERCDPVRSAKLQPFREQTVSYVPWKIHRLIDGSSIPHRIATGLPDDAVECGPVFHQRGDKLCVSFAGGVWNSSRSKLEYQLYVMTGPSFGELTAARPFGQKGCRSGFITEHLFANVARLDTVYLARATGSASTLRFSFETIYRVCPVDDAPESILITGAINKRHHTIRVNTKTFAVDELLDLSSSVYKATLRNGQLLHAVKLNDHEDRRIFRGIPAFGRSPVTIDVTGEIDSSLAQQTRLWVDRELAPGN